jgi:hypothetical protein
MAVVDEEKSEGRDHEQDGRIRGNTSTHSENTTLPNDPESPIPIEDKQPDIPPDGGYGWVCVACVFLINGHTWGVNSVSTKFPLAYSAALMHLCSLMGFSSPIISQITPSLALLPLNTPL